MLTFSVIPFKKTRKKLNKLFHLYHHLIKDKFKGYFLKWQRVIKKLHSKTFLFVNRKKSCKYTMEKLIFVLIKTRKYLNLKKLLKYIILLLSKQII